MVLWPGSGGFFQHHLFVRLGGGDSVGGTGRTSGAQAGHHAPFQPRSICVGQNFFVQGTHLRIGGGAAFKLDQAMEWEPLTVRPGQAEPLARVNAGVQRLLATIPAPRQR